MVALNRLGLFAALAGLGLALSACPGPTPTPDGGTDAGSDDCFEDTDCPDATLFFCNTTTSKCEPACRTKDQCTAGVRGQYALDYCASGLGCQCDEGKCVGSLCAGDSDCGTQVCRNGACVAEPAASTVASCQITPDFTILRGGAKAKFWVSTWDAAKNPVVLKTGITWSAAGGGLTLSGTGVAAQEFTVGTTASVVGPTDGAKATIGSVNCTAKVLVLPGTVPAGSLDVIATDELSGRPITGASVMASGAGGALVGAVGTTDANGYARLSGITGAVSVSVFHNDFNYLTIANYAGAASGDERFLSFVLRRNQVDKYGGYKGTFSNVPATSNVHAGLAGMSIPGSIVDLSVTQLLGPTKPTRVKIGNAIDQPDVPLPAGTYLGFTDTVIKSDISAQGLAGVCYDAAGAPKDAEIAAGSCGIRTAWALAGDVPLGDLPIDAFAGGANNIDFGKVLGRIIPIFRKFNSSVVRDVSFTLKTTPGASTGAPVFDDVSTFTSQNHDFTQIPLAFNFVVRAPDLPKFKGAYTDGMFLLGGAVVPGRGVVPLGIGAAVNTTPLDAKTDTQSELAGPGLVQMRMAPTHHGIEGTEYGIVGLAISLKSVTDSSAGLATSGLFARVPNNKITFDPKGANVVELGQSFLGFPDGAKYNFTDTPVGALGARTFKFAADPLLTGAAIVRVVFTDRFEHRWVVYLDPAQWSSGFTLPTPPGSFTDRTFWNDNTAAGDSRSMLLVQALRLNDNPGGGGQAITFAKLVELNALNADRMVDFTTAFAFVDSARPEVEWLTPSATGAAVAKNSAVKVKVSSFKVGTASTDDGYVKVTITGGTASTQCAAGADGKVDASQGKGEISVTLPTDCTGTGVTLTATLHDGANAALNPPVSAKVTGVNIN